MSVFLCLPSKRPPAEALKSLLEWRWQGYHVIIQRDPGEADIELEKVVNVVTRQYRGYAESVNHLTRIALGEGAEWIVCAGDDMYPDPHKDAETIARECSGHFRTQAIQHALNGGPDYNGGQLDALATFGVVQPTGDRWLVNGPGTKPGSECVAGSPWMGREWCRRINQGRGPLWEEYFHCGEDEELQEVAIKYGVFWQRPDLTHHHEHWGRPKEGEKLAHSSRMPEFLARANSREEWKKYKVLFMARQALGFPGSEPIA